MAVNYEEKCFMEQAAGVYSIKLYRSVNYGFIAMVKF